MQGRKELFYLTMNAIYSYVASDMVKDHSDSKKGNPLPPIHRIYFLIIFYMHHPTDRIVHIMAFVIPVVEHWLKQEIA